MFIPRHPVVENQFCQFTTYSGVAGTGGVGGVLAYAGAVCYLDENATNQDALVEIYAANEANITSDTDEIIPFGFLMQKVKMGYHNVHPTGFMMPGDLGSSDVIAQPSYSSAGVINGVKNAPVGVAHLGIWDTVHYVVKYGSTIPNATVAAGDGMLPGQHLHVNNDSNGVDGAGTSKVTNYINDNETDGMYSTVDVAVARVVKGAAAGQCQASVNNTTLYPIRIKLLV